MRALLYEIHVQMNMSKKKHDYIHEEWSEADAMYPNFLLF